MLRSGCGAHLHRDILERGSLRHLPVDSDSLSANGDGGSVDDEVADGAEDCIGGPSSGSTHRRPQNITGENAHSCSGSSSSWRRFHRGCRGRPRWQRRLGEPWVRGEVKRSVPQREVLTPSTRVGEGGGHGESRRVLGITEKSRVVVRDDGRRDQVVSCVTAVSTPKRREVKRDKSPTNRWGSKRLQREYQW